MQRIWHLLATLAWALWLGGLLATFLFVTVLFRQDHDLAVQTAPRLFHAFERYQLALAIAALGSSILLARKGISLLFLLAAAAAVASPVFITPKLNALQAQAQTHTHEFAQLHGISMLVYTATAGLVLLAGLILSNKSSH